MNAARELPAIPALPTDAVLLHVGVHKTGTTALQAALADARSELAGYDVRYPGRKAAHHAAAMAVLGRDWGWRDRGAVKRSPEQFDKVVAAAHEWPNRVVISSEHLCEADEATIARMADAFGRERLHVVVTLRSLGRLLPSSWQQYLKYGLERPYEAWLENTFDQAVTSKVSPSFWRRNEHGRLAQRWADAIGPQNVTFIVLEGVGHDAIFRSFAQLIGIPDEVLVSRMNLTSNRSMTAQECELLRRVNSVRGQLEWTQYEKLIRYGVARTIVEGREPAADEPKLHTPDWALDEAARRGAEQVSEIRASGVRVVGDLDALAARVPTTPAVDAAQVQQLPIDVAVSAIQSLVLDAAGRMEQQTLRDETRDVARKWRTLARSKVKRRT